MTQFHDDNFGHWEDMDDEGMDEFYNHVQRTNVEKICRGCGQTVNIQPQYDICNSCATILENGGDLPCNS